LSPSNDLLSLFEQALAQFTQGKGYPAQNIPKTKDAGCTSVKKKITITYTPKNPGHPGAPGRRPGSQFDSGRQRSGH
jgi:hypothetical protein